MDSQPRPEASGGEAASATPTGTSVAPTPARSLTPAFPVVPPSPSASSATSKDVTNLTSKIFENEVNTKLDNCFDRALPGCEIEVFRNREIDDVGVEIDSFAYMAHDTLGEGVPVVESGIYVVAPTDGSRATVLQAKTRQLEGSPGAKSKSAADKVEKKIIGESYSGDRPKSIKKKVKQLEKTINKMKERHEDQTGSTVRDVTCLVGAAILSFMNPYGGGSSRKDRADRCKEQISMVLKSEETPHLHRLAQGRRLFVLVLSANDAAQTACLRGMSTTIEALSVELGVVQGELKDVKGDLKDVQGELKDVKGDLKDVKGELKGVNGKLDQILKALLTGPQQKDDDALGTSDS